MALDNENEKKEEKSENEVETTSAAEETPEEQTAGSAANLDEAPAEVSFADTIEDLLEQGGCGPVEFEIIATIMTRHPHLIPAGSHRKKILHSLKEGCEEFIRDAKVGISEVNELMAAATIALLGDGTDETEQKDDDDDSDEEDNDAGTEEPDPPATIGGDAESPPDGEENPPDGDRTEEKPAETAASGGDEPTPRPD